MRDIEHRLAEVEARFAITDIVHKFCRAADRSDLEAIPPLFHKGAVDNHGFYEGDVPGLVMMGSGVRGTTFLEGFHQGKRRRPTEGPSAWAPPVGPAWVPSGG